jgi:hypothetical protein
VKTFDIKVTVRKMGRKCANCIQRANGKYKAENAEAAIAMMKQKLNVDLDTHQVSIDLIREV